MSDSLANMIYVTHAGNRAEDETSQKNWRGFLRICVVSAAVFLACDCRSEEPTSESFGLLIGINEYANLSQSRQLGGCVNDVELMRSVLTTYAGFSDEKITTLINADATRNRILEGLERLKSQVKNCNANGASAKVVLHFSGHGSQVMDQLHGPMRDEKTFFDQTIVPSDADRAGGELDIRDDTLNQWSREICSFPGNRLFVVLDCCHSGTGLRGMKRYRRLDRPLVSPVKSDFAPIATPSVLPPNVAVISACRSDQLEPEYQAGEKAHGLLTFWLCRLAEESSREANFALSSLPEFLRWKYINEADALLPPDPQLETSGQMSFGGLLFVSPNQTQSQVVLVQVDSRGASRMMQGHLDGVKANESYDVYRNSGLLAADKVGVFVAKHVSATISQGFTEFTTASNASLQNETKKYFCAIKGGVEDQKVTMKLSSAASSDGSNIDTILNAVPHLRSDLVRYQIDDVDASFHLHVTANQVHLSRIGMSLDNETAKPIVTLDRDDAFKSRFAKLIRQIVAIKRLQSLVADGASKRLYTQKNQPESLAVQLQMGAIVDGAYRFQPASISDDGVVRMRTGDVYVVNVQHPRGKDQDVYATIVHIDPQLDLAMMCPEAFSSGDRSQQQVSTPEGLTTRAFICNADATRERSDPEYREARPGVHRAIVIVASQPADLSSVFRFVETEPRGGKSLGQPKSAVSSIKIDFQAQPRGKSLMKRSFSKSSAENSDEGWWDAAMIHWVCDE
ncbi:MAG: caspase family protein [Pirellulaceae bacterium]